MQTGNAGEQSPAHREDIQSDAGDTQEGSLPGIAGSGGLPGENA